MIRRLWLLVAVVWAGQALAARIAERRADEEQRRDFAALESRAERGNRERHLPEKRGAFGRHT